MGRGTGTDEAEKIEEGVVGRGDGDMAAAAVGNVGMMARSKYPSPPTAGPEAFNTPGIVTTPEVPALDSIAGEKCIAGWLLLADGLSGDRAALPLPLL